MSSNILRREININPAEWENRRLIEEGKVISELFFGLRPNSIIEIGKLLHFIKSKGLHQSAVIHLTKDWRRIQKSFQIYCTKHLKVLPNLINAYIILATKLDSRPPDEIDLISSLNILSSLALEEQETIEPLSPPDNSLISTLTPSFDWYDTPYAGFYELQICIGNPCFAGSPDIVYDNSSITSSGFNLPSGVLNSGILYFWRVRPGKSGCAWGSWTEPTQFDFITQ